jgi:hypothetical protein
VVRALTRVLFSEVRCRTFSRGLFAPRKFDVEATVVAIGVGRGERGSDGGRIARPEPSREGKSRTFGGRRRTKAARDEDHAQLYPRSYSSSSLTGTVTLVSPPAFRRLLAENMAPLAGSAGAKFRKPRGWSAMSR